ncbi:MAG: translation initiation factor IF-2 [Alphaproteobacteria bacterium]|jgi:translation initiation factor IF-2|uniref:translation initiation factor IF-2 n=1 Tax=Devosia sp. XGJD_8 TaxID=3391187 RepID=UPI001E0F5B90|nr:translation initiation factor IF-2 [Alphaproteobacteria bacterium]MBU1562264.1 translation initiation factor IF-2 [Alphaproteobacteria bacterium]MBU2302764.1 translation initiation factor IF-2 [Alphaproteobacteria bacterium]MBU2366692.1 translation initiation factor IF-2 [Alphaproteobacteria bacterium]
MADNDDKRTDDTGAKKTLTLKGGPGLGNRPGMSRGPSRSTVVVEKRTRLVPKPNAPSAPHRPQPAAGNPSQAQRPSAGRPPQQQRAPLGLSAAEAEARRQALAMAGARAAEDQERFAAEEARRMEDDARRRQVREEAARQEEERRQAEEVPAPVEQPEASPPPAEASAAGAAEAPAPAEAVPFTPASQRNAGPSSVRVVAGRPGQPPRPTRPAGERPSGNTRPESERGANAYIKPGAAGAPGARPSGTATRPAGERRPAGAGMAPIGNVPPAPPSEADGRKIRTGAPATRPTTEAELENARRASRAAPERPTRRAGVDANARGRLTVTNAGAESDRDKGPSLAAMRRRRDKKMGRNQQDAPKLSREVIIPEAITVAELANRMAERSVTVIKMLMAQGTMATINDVIDADTAELIASELGHTVKRVSDADVEEGLYDIPADDKAEDLTDRAPVVTIMGHVDHGKTSLLDAIREANVVSGEAGGITQHIGAYQVEKNGSKVTFLDTPGHEAFTAMRARGAQATDIAVLVVAADDGVMPQTIESIKHAKAAGVPIIVAINKMDKPDADPMRVRTELLQHEVFVESMGGDVLDVEVSAKTQAGLDKLLETILLQAEVLELRVARDGRAEGLVIEAKLDRGRGAVATVLVQRGTLSIGDILVAGTEFARVRALINDKGEQVKQAGPSTPVEVLGFTGVPSAGDRFSVVETEARAREVTEYRQRSIREKTAGGGATSLEQMMNQLKVAGIAKFPLIIKGDVQGSVEAIVASLNKLSTDEVSAQILMSAVGGITESDVTLASASNAIVIGFNVRANKQATDLATRDGIEIRYYNIIYDLVDDVKNAMSGLLKPERRETFIGNAEILEVFTITKVGKVAGCRVTEGIVERGAGVRLIRDNVVIHEGKLKTLKRFKDEVKEVQTGQECGMAFENYEDMRTGDVIECFRVETVQRSL